MRQIEKTITATTFSEAVAPLQELAADMLGLRNQNMSLAFRTV